MTLSPTRCMSIGWYIRNRFEVGLFVRYGGKTCCFSCFDARSDLLIGWERRVCKFYYNVFDLLLLSKHFGVFAFERGQQPPFYERLYEPLSTKGSSHGNLLFYGPRRRKAVYTRIFSLISLLIFFYIIINFSSYSIS